MFPAGDSDDSEWKNPNDNDGNEFNLFDDSD